MTHSLSIDHITLYKSPGQQRTALQRVLQHTLDHLMIPGGQLPGSAIVLIRELAAAAPFPAQVAARRHWMAQVSAAIVEQVQQAHRPALQADMPGANCVLFVDSVEMLLCYTADRLRGRQRWYWRRLFPDARQVVPALFRAWQQYPQALPAVLTHLPVKDVYRILQGTTPAQIDHLIGTLHRQFGLSVTIPPAQLSPIVMTPSTLTLETDSPDYAEPDRAPWSHLLSVEESLDLSPQRHYVWGLAHILARQPQLARSPSFEQEVTHWFQSVQHQAQPPAMQAEETIRLVHSDYSTSVDIIEKQQEMTQQVASTETDLFTDSGELRKSGQLDSFSTALGGVFYLINFVEWVLTVSSADAVFRLSRWELVAALADTILCTGTDDIQRADDPVWQVLHDLAVQPQHMLWGQSLDQPSTFALLPACFAMRDIKRIGYCVQLEDMHLRVTAPEINCVLYDGVATGTPVTDLIQQYADAGINLYRLENSFVDETPVPESVHPYLHGWLRGALSLYNWRLHQMRRVQSSTETNAIAMLHIPATGYITQTHIDIWFDINRINMGARRTGLDQNPGWAADYGYIITFHFH